MATTTAETKLRELLEDFETAMLVTRTADGELRSRPMQLASADADGTLWFMTQRDSGKLGEIAADNHVNVALQEDRRYVSISGTAHPHEDRAKVAELWNEAWKIWFPGGKDDPNLLLLKVQGRSGEYWDNSGSSGIKYLIEAGRAYLSGTEPDVDGDPKIHGSVTLG